MAAEKTVLYFGPGHPEASPLVSRFGEQNALRVLAVTKSAEVRALLNRTFPACLVLETDGDAEEVLDLCRTLKQDAFTAIVPLVVLVPAGASELAAECLEAGADEVVHEGLPPGRSSSVWTRSSAGPTAT